MYIFPLGLVVDIVAYCYVVQQMAWWVLVLACRYIQSTCATTGEGLYEGLDWLSSNIASKVGANFSVCFSSELLLGELCSLKSAKLCQFINLVHFNVFAGLNFRQDFGWMS
jgi:hypothetical protein